MEPIATRDANQVTLVLKGGLLKNEHSLLFEYDTALQAQKWSDRLSPLFDAELVDEVVLKVKPLLPSANEEAGRALQANTTTSPAQLLDVLYYPRDPPQLDGCYWDIYSKEWLSA
jgi:hypothetical protein